MKWTKAKVQAWCDERGITISYVKHLDNHHVHFDIDSETPMRFRLHDLHNISMWDSDDKSPDWNAIGQRLEGLDFGPCEDPECEYCLGDDNE